MTTEPRTRLPCIVLEGPDGGGKTTLGRYLEGGLPEYKYLHTGGAVKSREDLHARMALVETNILEAWEGVRPPIIFDRIPQISQLVYQTAVPNPAFRPLPLLDPEFGPRQLLSPQESRQSLYRATVSKGYYPLVVIFCCPSDPELAWSNVDRETKPHKPSEYLRKVEDAHGLITRLYSLILPAVVTPPHTLLWFAYDRQSPEEFLVRKLIPSEPFRPQTYSSPQ